MDGLRRLIVDGARVHDQVTHETAPSTPGGLQVNPEQIEVLIVLLSDYAPGQWIRTPLNCFICSPQQSNTRTQRYIGLDDHTRFQVQAVHSTAPHPALVVYVFWYR